MGGRTWTQNSKCPKLDSWSLTYIKSQEVRWGILPLAACSGSTVDIIPPKFQVFSFQSNKLKEEVAESSLDRVCIERKKEIREKVQWLTFPTRQVLTFHCALRQAALLPNWYFQGCWLAMCFLIIIYSDSLQPYKCVTVTNWLYKPSD